MIYTDPQGVDHRTDADPRWDSASKESRGFLQHLYVARCIGLDQAEARIAELEAALRGLLDGVKKLEGVEMSYPIAIGLSDAIQAARRALEGAK